MLHCKGDENGTARGWSEHVGNWGDMVDRWRCCVYGSFLEVDLERERESEKKRGREAAIQPARQSDRETEKERKRTKGTENVGKIKTLIEEVEFHLAFLPQQHFNIESYT